MPDDVRWRAQQYLASLQSANARAAEQQAHADLQRRQASSHRSSARGLRIALLAWAGMGLVGFVPTVLVAVNDVFVSLFDELELWAAIGASALIVGVAFVGFSTLCALGYVLWRRSQRHKLEGGHHFRHEFGASQSALAVCSHCGASIAFRIGETSIQCGHCRTVVMPSVGHKQKLVALALEQTQVAELHSARAERARILVEVKRKRTQRLFTMYATLGSLACLTLPFLGAFYVFRTFTRSIEQTMADLAEALQGSFAGGPEPIFEWLDDFWVGRAPETLTSLEPTFFESRWSIHASYAGRPALLVTITDSTDRTAKRVVGLLARPRIRDHGVRARVGTSEPAQRVRSMGWALTVDNAGVAVEAQHVKPQQLNVETFTYVMHAAYEVAELG